MRVPAAGTVELLLSHATRARVAESDDLGIGILHSAILGDRVEDPDRGEAPGAWPAH
jgi:hypothetical protein